MDRAIPIRIFIPVFLAALVSGCFTTTTETGNGVVIKAFAAEFTDVYSDECVDFSALIKNTGSVKAEHVSVKLLGVGDNWQGGCGSGDISCSSFSLLPPDPTVGTEGQTKQCKFSYMIPKLPPNTDLSYDLFFRVIYSYRTEVIKSVTIMTRDEMKNLINQGKTLPLETQSSTNSPISINVITSTPIRLYSDNVEFPIKINIDNNGGGTVCSGGLSECSASSDNWKKMRIRIDPDSGISLSDECKGDIEITLYQGKSNSVTCTATADSIPNQRTQKLLNVYSEYTYFTDQEMNINIHGSVS